LGDDAGAWLKAHGWHMGGFALVLFALLYLMIVVVKRRRVAAR
jgi:hypothetical protein